MRGRLPVVLSLLALLIALLGWTGVGEAALKSAEKAVKSALFAKNAGAVNGIQASATPKPGELLPLGSDGQFPSSVIPQPASGGGGGTSSPGPNSVGSDQVIDGSLTGADIEDGSLTGDDIKDGSLSGADIKDGSLPVSALETPVPAVQSGSATVVFGAGQLAAGQADKLLATLPHSFGTIVLRCFSFSTGPVAHVVLINGSYPVETTLWQSDGTVISVLNTPNGQGPIAIDALISGKHTTLPEVGLLSYQDSSVRQVVSLQAAAYAHADNTCSGAFRAEVWSSS